MNYCFLCGQEAKFNLRADAEIQCWRCVEKILVTPQEKLKRIYRELIERGYKEKAEHILFWISEKEVRNEFRKNGSNLDRKRASRKARSSRKRRNG